jgi:hypothetical protein
MKTFKHIQVRTLTHELVTSLEVAIMNLGTACTREDIERAYSHACLAREALYEELSALERQAGIMNQPVKLRF